MKLSLITVCYNSEQTIRETLESVKSQSIKPCEIEYIIIDGGSNDSTLSIIQEYSDIVHEVVSEKDNGIYNAMNKGLKMASGDIIGFLNSDDVYTERNILKEVKHKFDTQEIDFLYGDLEYVKRGNSLKTIRTWKSNSFSRISLDFGWMPPHPTFFAKKRCYDLFGDFDETLKSASDYDLMLRFVSKNSLIGYYHKKTMVKMKSGGNSGQSISHRLKVLKEDFIALKKNNIGYGYISVFSKILRKIPQYF